MPMLSCILQLVVVSSFEMRTVLAFQPSCHNRFSKKCILLHRSHFQKSQLTSTRMFAQFSPDDDYTSEDDSDLFNDMITDETTNDEEQDQLMNELAWRSKQISLEEENTRRFTKALKSKPWKLPYEESRRWVQANFGAETKEEFFDLVENGNLRTPYIPKDPEKYYSENGTWISWQHFLFQEEAC